jgi:SAM-dependent methyltransferase
VSDCRACHATTLPWLDLGKVPLANALDSSMSHPLAVERCRTCGTSQLIETLPPETLFTASYPYASGVSASFTQHCRKLAARLSASYPAGRLLDIGCNDGTLLDAAADRGMRVIGVDPASANATLPGAFPAATAGLERIDVITALNVLGHVPDPHAFVAEVARLLTPDGVFVLEVPYVRPLLEHGAFDTIYHEHMTYWSLAGLNAVLWAHNLGVVDLTPLPNLHGGSVRLTAMRNRVGVDWPDEIDLRASYLYDRFRVKQTERVQKLWDAFAATSGRIAAFGASAKGAIFAHVAGVGPSTLSYVVDETPGKQGHTTPYGVKIGPLDWLRQEPAEAVWVTPWNFEAEIRHKLQPYRVKRVVVV